MPNTGSLWEPGVAQLPNIEGAPTWENPGDFWVTTAGHGFFQVSG